MDGTLGRVGAWVGWRGGWEGWVGGKGGRAGGGGVEWAAGGGLKPLLGVFGLVMSPRCDSHRVKHAYRA